MQINIDNSGRYLPPQISKWLEKMGLYMRREATSKIQYELLLLVIGKVVVYPFIVKITLC